MKFFVLCALVAVAVAQPAKNDLWKGSSMDQMVDQTKIECAQKNDEVSCMKFKVLNLLDQIFRKDSFKASGASSIRHDGTCAMGLRNPESDIVPLPLYFYYLNRE